MKASIYSKIITSEKVRFLTLISNKTYIFLKEIKTIDFLSYLLQLCDCKEGDFGINHLL